jgi:hypothetical protein
MEAGRTPPSISSQDLGDRIGSAMIAYVGITAWRAAGLPTEPAP